MVIVLCRLLLAKHKHLEKNHSGAWRPIDSKALFNRLIFTFKNLSNSNRLHKFFRIYNNKKVNYLNKLSIRNL